jgi:uncharacterized membrane protein
MMARILVVLFLFLAISISLYPLAYLLSDMQGLLSSKSPNLLSNRLWWAGFYTHIILGGVALLSGCTQFLPKLRQKYLGLHRSLGKIYVVSVALSGTAGLGIAFAGSGGLFAQSGFGVLAILWLYTTSQAYRVIRRKEIRLHQQWMIRSYALCFAAVTLRIWLPLFTVGLGLPFDTAYPIIAWLCWVPNLTLAEVWIRRNFG